MYTSDLGSDGHEKNVFYRLNKVLNDRGMVEVMMWRDYLFLLLSSLRKLPRFRPQSGALYRGISARVKLDATHYAVGNTVTWHSFCSTSVDMAVTKGFITDRKTGLCSGTLFIVRGNCWGYDISEYSCVPGEKGNNVYFTL
jgi:hypothetical protein